MTGPWPWLLPLLLVLLASGAGALWWARRRYVAVSIDGPSMSPTHVDGDMVLVRRASVAVRGEVVAFIPRFAGGVVPSANGGRLWLLKRVVAAPGESIPPEYVEDGAAEVVPDGHYFVVGDNLAESYDSRHEGPIAASRLRGVLVREL